MRLGPEAAPLSCVSIHPQDQTDQGTYRFEAAVEETFVNRDPQSALKLGQARGVALVVPSLAGIRVAEYSANLVKKTVVGSGHADKAQIAMMVKVLLPRSDAASPDAADALAVAICHAQHRGAKALRERLAAGQR